MVPEAELFYLSLYLDVIVVFCVFGPAFPYDCFVVVTPALLVHDHVGTADQSQRAFEVFRAVASLRKRQAAIGLLVAQDII